MATNALQRFIGGIQLAFAKADTTRVGLRIASAPATSYNITLPSAAPAETSILQMASNGVVSFTTLETGTNRMAARVASTGNIAIAAPGATIDGVALNVGDLVLLKDQTTATENGPYAFQGAATPMTRATSFDTSAEVLPGLSVFVSEGTANDNRTYQLTTNGPITLGTTNLTFTQTGGALGTASIANGGTGATTAAAARTNLGVPGIFRQAIVDGDLTTGTIAITHGLGQRYCQVSLYDDGNRLIPLLDEVTATSTTVVTLDLTSFGTLAGTWNVVIVG